jgi:hypothetical protein
MDKSLKQLLEDRDQLERFRNSGDPFYQYGVDIAWAALDKEADRLDRLIAELSTLTTE